MDEVRVLLVDDSAVVRCGVRTLLELDEMLVVVGEAGDGDAALVLAEETAPDIVLLDVRMPKRDGLSVVADLAARARVLMLTFSDEPHVVRAAMDAGAVGYLVHGSFDADSLAATVRSAASGMAALSGSALAAMRGAVPESAATRWGLSDRQEQVMALIIAGCSNREIARELYLTEKTVKNHINQLFAKLGTRSRGQAVATWLGTFPPGTDLVEEPTEELEPETE